MHKSNIYPSARLDALNDGIFSVAMTLLVLDVRLPDDFKPASDRDLIVGLIGLGPKLFPYVLSFIVLGLRWLAALEGRNTSELVGRSYAVWTLFYLLLITCIPFSTIVVGRYASLAPAVWLYAGNTALVAVVAFILLQQTPNLARDDLLIDRRVSLAILSLSSTLAIIWSFVNVRQALIPLALNILAPQVTRWFKQGSTEAP